MSLKAIDRQADLSACRSFIGGNDAMKRLLAVLMICVLALGGCRGFRSDVSGDQVREAETKKEESSAEASKEEESPAEASKEEKSPAGDSAESESPGITEAARPAEKADSGRTEAPAEKADSGRTEAPAEKADFGRTEHPAGTKASGSKNDPAETPVEDEVRADSEEPVITEAPQEALPEGEIHEEPPVTAAPAAGKDAYEGEKYNVP
jgi:hypothetical protein